MTITTIPPAKNLRVEDFIYVDFKSAQGAPLCYVARKGVLETDLKYLERQKADFATAVKGCVLSNEQIDHMVSLENALMKAYLVRAQSCQWRIESAQRELARA